MWRNWRGSDREAPPRRPSTPGPNCPHGSEPVWTGWSTIWRTLLIGAVGYLILVILLRGTGLRTMATMTPLGFVIAVTLGSAFGRISRQ